MRLQNMVLNKSKTKIHLDVLYQGYHYRTQVKEVNRVNQRLLPVELPGVLELPEVLELLGVPELLPELLVELLVVQVLLLVEGLERLVVLEPQVNNTTLFKDLFKSIKFITNKFK